MKQNLLKYAAACLPAGFCFLFPFSVLAQPCEHTPFQGQVYDYVCPQSCSTLAVQIPHIKSSTDYRVTTIPHNPFPWVSGTGTELVELYADDMFSSVIPLPFPFCFYGDIYNSCVVGSNGILSFDLSNASKANAWSLTTVPHGSVPQPVPFAGGTPNTTTSTYYPRASIMGAYHDIYPLLNPGGQRRVEYSTIGTAPCRKFVISYYLVPLYGSTVCNNRYCSQQIVLHENTGVIDVHLGDKPVCNDWNQGLAILGLQNWNRDAAVTAPGKNCTVWSESQTSYRFTPSGPGSRFIRSELHTLGGALVALADTVTTVPGLLDIRFQNICPPLDTTRYEVISYFNSCNDPALQLLTRDTLTTIRDNNLGATASMTNNACGPPSGTITVTVPAGAGTAPFTYTLDGGAPVTAGTSHTFTGVVHGAHTVVVMDANGALGCVSTINITVGRNNGILSAYSTSPAFCAGSPTGSATITVNNGTGPYQYNLNSGAVIVTDGAVHTFTGLTAGTHQVVITDATGCMSDPVIFTIINGPGVAGNSSSTATSCPAATNGTITITATAGVAPFRFILDGGPPQSGPNPFTFTNLSAGAHVVTILDNAGCTLPMNITVNAGPVLSAANTAFATSCNGAADGSIRVSPLSGLAPYTYSLDGTAAVPGPVPRLFTGLTSGAHTIQVFDAAGCESVIYAVNVPSGPDLVTTAVKTDILCNGAATGSITVNQPSTGTAPFQYSLDGVNWQGSRTFTGLAANTYTVQFRSADGCSGSLVVLLTEPSALTAFVNTTPVTCNGQPDAVISATGGGGVSPYQYSIDGGSSWQSSGIFNVSAGNYTLLVKDANNCISPRPVTVTEPAVLTATSANRSATCDGGNDGRIVVNATGGNSGYLYSTDGINYQSSNTFSTGPGNYTVYVKDSKGCRTSFTTTVDLQFNLFLNPMPDLTICEGSSIQFRPVSNAGSYTWSPAAHLDFPFIADPVANPVDTTWYYLQAVLGRCTLYDTIRLNVNKAPVPDAGPGAAICYGQSYTLQGSGGVDYTWSPALYLSTSSGANPVSTPTQSTTYYLHVKDMNGCTSLEPDTVQVDVKRVMSVRTIPFDTIVAPGEQFRLLAISQGITYHWSPAAGLSNPDIQDPVVRAGTVIGSEMQYQVTAINAEGCKGEGYVKIRVHEGPAIYVPTAFTPNGDGKNDLFTPRPVGVKAYNYFNVYNRWGQLVFSTRQLHRGWDGTVQGQAQPAGTYVWMIEGLTPGNQPITRKGTVTLIR